MNNENLEKLYGEYLKFNDNMILKYDALAIAAIMMAQALSMYKTVLSEKDYDAIVDNMSNNRDKIKKFEGQILQ